ncbi:MAG: prephenate dehydrogenase [Lachnospiraceae bacterium]|nr:prephenate dehydrogenase [Lachnospiraceae bacterium]
MKIGFIGLGLIGGSIAKGLKKAHSDIYIIAHTRSRDSLLPALNDGVIDEIAEEIDEAFGSCDVIYLCTPVANNRQFLVLLKDVISENTIITDVGSTKADICRSAEGLGMEKNFCGGHPMAGSERSGYANSSDHLLENAFYLLTPTKGTPERAVELLTSLAKDLGSTVKVLSASEHDETVAAISHLPHLVACSLVDAVRDNDKNGLMKTLAAGGFKDITRIASSSPDMWEQICASNREPIADYIRKHIASMEAILSMVEAGDGAGIHELFSEAGAYRNSITDSLIGPIDQQFYLYCDLVDRPGAIAEIAVLLATRSISIKNIGIIQNRNSEPGALRIQFYDKRSRDAAAAVLKQYNFLAE